MLMINMNNKAIAQTTKAYNSSCIFNNIPLAATSSGLYRITGYTDAGTSIPALIKSGAIDFGVENKKRFRFFYFGVETNGSLKLSVYGDNTLAGSYTVTGLTTGMRIIRVPIKRDVNAWYWQWQVENVSGSFFVLHSVRALAFFLHPGHN